VEWKAPVYNTVHHILTNPVYGVSAESSQNRTLRAWTVRSKQLLPDLDL